MGDGLRRVRFGWTGRCLGGDNAAVCGIDEMTTYSLEDYLTGAAASGHGADALLAVAPNWRHADFVAAVAGLSARLRAAGCRQAALWFDDAALFACALLACGGAGVTAYLPPNLTDDNRRWGDEVADVWLTDHDGLSVEQPQWPIGQNPLPSAASMCSGSLDAGLAVVLKTSGSSGEAKIIHKTWGQLQAEADALLRGLCLPAQTLVVGSVTPQHLYGLTFRIVLALCAGWPMWRPQCVYPESLLEASTGPCVWVVSPTLLNAVCDHGIEPALARQVAGVFAAGGALPASTAERLAGVLPQAVCEIYGSTETGIIGWRQWPQAWRFFDGVAADADADGVLALASPWSGGLQQTADAVRLHPQGFDLLGRTDRMVKLADKRVSLQALEHDLLRHDWVADAHCSLHPQRRRVAAWLALSAAGLAALRDQGRPALVAALRWHLAAGHDPVALPRYWRFERVLPRNSQGKLAAAEVAAALASRPQQAIWQVLAAEDNGQCRLTAWVPPDLVYFSGHFDRFPLVPGVVELDWVLAVARRQFVLPPRVVQVENLKFQQFLRPGDQMNLWLHWQADKGKLLFKLDSEAGVCASGRVVLADQRGAAA